MKHTEFFVIIPAYNAETTIERCIDSVTTQAYDMYSLIIVDDGSSDDTEMIVKKLAEQNKRIALLQQENAGQIAARHAGVEYALAHSSEDVYLMFLDADDELKSGSLERLSELIDNNPCDMLFFSAENYDAKTDTVRGKLSGDHEGSVTSKSELYKIVLSDPGYNSLCRKVIAKRVFSSDDYKSYTDLRYGEDLIQSLDYYRASKSVYFTREVFYRYHINYNSMTHSVDFYSFPIDSTVRRLTWEFVTSENVWSENELNDYAQFLIDLLEKKLVSLSCFHVPYREKAKVFDGVIEDPFYSMLLNRDLSHGRLITLLLKRRYHSLILSAKLRKIRNHFS